MTAVVPEHHRALALEILEQLRAHGFTALWAGGCVRDQLLGREPEDFDVATNATPAEIRALFGRRRTREIGAAFGVVSVHGRRSAGHVEVATFRSDSTYSDGRHPDKVTYSTPEEDARRRDFTINGLFYDPVCDQVIDYVEGQADLQRQLLRAIGDPQRRFAEDKLRMLRAVRFAAKFDFQLDATTQAAITQMHDQIHVVSIERIAQELRKMLALPRRSRAMQLLVETGLLAEVLPELQPLHDLPSPDARRPDESRWQFTLRVLDALQHPAAPLAWAALLHAAPGATSPSGANQPGLAAEIVRAICRRLRLSRHDETCIVWLVRHQRDLAEARHVRWAQVLRTLAEPGIEDLLALHEALAKCATGDTSSVDYCWELLRTTSREELAPPPLVTGHDLLRHGIPQGTHFQRLLHDVYDAQLEKRVSTQHEALRLIDRWLAEGPATQDDTPPHSR